jgi:hypothetical protein
VDPGFDLRVAAALIPCTPEALRQCLSRHREAFPARYRLDGTRRRHRVLFASEINEIRSMMLRPRRAPRREAREEGAPRASSDP